MAHELAEHRDPQAFLALRAVLVVEELGEARSLDELHRQQEFGLAQGKSKSMTHPYDIHSFYHFPWGQAVLIIPF